MSKVYVATPDLSMYLGEDKLAKLPEFFSDPKNPTEAELRKYFDDKLQNYAGSNDGSEMLANASYTIHVEDK